MKLFYTTLLPYSLTLVCLLLSTKNNAQKSLHIHGHGGKRIKILQPTGKQLYTLTQVGVDLKCGAQFTKDAVFLELNEDELNCLDKKNINYTVVIEDLIEFNKKRSAERLPLAIKQLKTAKQESINKQATKSVSTATTTISNVIQYEGATEENWAIPQNFNLGSMAGCLTYDEMLTELDRMRALYPNLISVKKDASLAEDGSGTPIVTHGNNFTNGGQYNTWPGQTIYYVRISDNPDNDEANEPESFYSGMTHSREVSSMMNLIFYMWYVLENYDTDPDVKNLVDNNEMYFVPVANPDGLRWNEERAPNGGGLQRKNLEPNSNTGNNFLRGVDLNRNYSYLWGSEFNGSSGSINSDTYRGVAPFSEPETQIIEVFTENHDVKTALNHHATSNLLPHGYNGEVNAPPSGREDDYAQFCQDLTRFNRYIYGEAPNILTVANGDMSDWMLGGAPRTNSDGSVSSGSGKGILALAPENGDPSGLESNPNFNSGFWPSPDQIVNIARRAMRMNFVNALYAGKTAQLHDMTPSNLTATSGTLNFGIEYLGMTLSDLTLTVTPISSNIISIGSLPIQTGWAKQEQRQVVVSYQLGSASANDSIEYQVTLSNDTNIIYQANIIKYFTPTELFVDNPDTDGISNWTASSNWNTTTDAFSGSTAITNDPTPPYANNRNATLTLNNSINLSSVNTAVIQFYAKWDIERNFDYAQIQASIDGGSTWIALHGKYTKPGATLSSTRYSPVSGSGGTVKSNADRDNQPDGKPLYEGFNDGKWVLEEIEISDSDNSIVAGANNLQLRFLFNSDGSNNADGYTTNFDGFTFDDFRVLSYDLDHSCINGTQTFPHVLDFEEGLATWTQNTEDDGDLTLGTGNTPSNNTGPNQAIQGEYYLFAESSANNIGLGGNATTIITSPCLDIDNLVENFIFNYHMLGSNTGSLALEVKDSSNSTWTTLFTRTGQQNANGNDWRTAIVDITTYQNSTVQFRFTVTTGLGTSDIAIDNVRIVPPDTIPPIAICQNIIIDLNEQGNAIITTSQIDNGSTDNVGIETYSLDINTFDCSNIGNNTVTLTVTDFNGLTNSCVATVTINPFISIPSGLTATAITSTTATLVWDEALLEEYRIRFRESGTSTWTTSPTITTNSHSLTSLNPETTYDTQVRVFCGDTPATWSETVNFTTESVCGTTTVNSYPYTEGFNTNIGDWVQNSSDDGNWTVDGDGTATGDTGPSTPAEGTDYIYIEASDPLVVNDPNAIGFNATAIITSPCIDLTDYTDVVLSYQYHMYGSDMGTLDTQVSIDGGLNWSSVLSAIYSSDMGNQWNSEILDFNSYSGQIIQIRFVGITGNDFRSDMALDDIEITAITTLSCPSITTYTSTGWDNGSPDQTTRAVIADNYDTANLGSIIACELTINSGIILTVNDATYISIENDITVDGTMSVSNTGSVVQIAEDAVTINNGAIAVARSTPLLEPRDFIALSSPMSGDTKTNVYASANRVFGIISNNFSPNTEVSNDFPTAANFLDDNGDYLDKNITSLTPSTGYLVFPQAVTATSPIIFNHTYTQGTLNSGHITASINYNSSTSTDNFNLIGNPYASAIDTDMLISSNPVINEVYFWEHITTPNESLPGFNPSNFSMDDVSVRNAIMGIPAVNDMTASIPSQFMASGQGFGILANGAEASNGTDALFTNAMRVTSGSNILRNADLDNKIWLRLNVDEYSIQSTTAIGFIPEATPDFDPGYDSRQLATSISLFSTLENGEQLAIQSRELFDSEIEIAIGFQSLIEDDNAVYTINLQNIEGIYLISSPVFLTDHITGKVTNLKETSYTFRSSKGLDHNRFTLRFKNDILNNDEFTLNEFTLFPNPTKNIVTLRSNTSQSIHQVVIRDLLGKKVKTLNTKPFDKLQTFNIGDLNTGVYFFQVMTESSSKSIRVIKY